jgi:hypothetical protein
MNIFGQRLFGIKAAVPMPGGATDTPSLIESAQATVAAPVSQAQDAIQMAHVQSITAMAGNEQASLALQLIASGKTELEAAKALHSDLKAQNAELKKQLAEVEAKANSSRPVYSVQDVAAEAAKQLRAEAQAQALPSTIEQKSDADLNVYEQYQNIKDEKARGEFYAAHKTEIDSIERSMNSKKEDK